MTDAAITDAGILGIWQPYPDVQVETWLQPHGAGHLRLHRITSDVALETVEGGFALCHRDGATDRQQSGRGLARIEGAGQSMIHGLPGDLRSGRIHGPAANTNLQHPRSWVPQLTARIAPGVILLARHVQAGDRAALQDLPAPDLRGFPTPAFAPAP